MDQRKLTVLEATDVALQRGLKAGLEKGLQVALKYMYKQAFAEGLKVGLLAGGKAGRRAAEAWIAGGQEAEVLVEGLVSKYCPKCKLVKSADKFGNNRARQDGLADYCKECSRAIQRSWLRRNSEAVAQQKRERRQFLRDSL